MCPCISIRGCVRLFYEFLDASNISIKKLEGLKETGSLGSLTGLAGISAFLSTRKIRTVHELKNMGYDDQRNTIIADLAKNTAMVVASLQALSDFELVTKGFKTSFYNTRSLMPASFGQSYWLVGCMSNSNGKKVFKEVKYKFLTIDLHHYCSFLQEHIWMQHHGVISGLVGQGRSGMTHCQLA